MRRPMALLGRIASMLRGLSPAGGNPPPSRTWEMVVFGPLVTNRLRHPSIFRRPFGTLHHLDVQSLRQHLDPHVSEAHGTVIALK
jgi:hypothetical protein